MDRCLLVFYEEFLDYVRGLIFDDVIRFGNMEFDYELIKEGFDYRLFVYDVALDHYGMPYRNNNCSRSYFIDRTDLYS